MPDEPITPTREMRVSPPTSDANSVPEIVIGPETTNRDLTRYTDRTILAERWEVQEFLGEGGMSSVYKTKHLAMGRFAAAKILHPHLSFNDKHLQRFQREAQAASALSHPNVISVYDCGVTPDGRPFILMEYLQGKSLADEIRDKGAMGLDRALEIFLAVCDGMAHAHEKGIVHRDLKPSNVMLITNADGKEQAKIVDFGIARVIPREGAEGEAMHQLTQTGEVFGSPLYMSPEQCLGKHLDQRSDVYAMGCLMYEVLAGFPPLKGESFLETLHMQLEEIPKPFVKAGLSNARAKMVEGVILKCLAKEPNERYGNMRELRSDLDSAARDYAWFSFWRTKAGRELFKRFRSENKKGLARLNLMIVSAAVVFPISLFLIWATVINAQFDKIPTGIDQMHNAYWPQPFLKKIVPRLSVDLDKGGATMLSVTAARRAYERDPVLGVEEYSTFLYKGATRVMPNGEYATAIEYLGKLLPLRLERYGEEDPDVWLARLAMAKCYYFLDDYARAEKMYRDAFRLSSESPLAKNKEEYLEGFGIYAAMLLKSENPDYDKIASVYGTAADWALSQTPLTKNTKPDPDAYLRFANLRADALRLAGDPANPNEIKVVARMNEISPEGRDAFEVSKLERRNGAIELGVEHQRLGPIKKDSRHFFPARKTYKDIYTVMEEVNASDFQKTMYWWGKGCLYQKFGCDKGPYALRKALDTVSAAPFAGSNEIEAQIRKDLILSEEKSNPIAAIFDKAKAVVLWNNRAK